MTRVSWMLCVASVLLMAGSLRGQGVPTYDEHSVPSNQRQTMKNESRSSFNIFATATFANNGFYAKTFDRHLTLVGLGYDLIIYRNHLLALRYTPEIVPVAVLSQPSINGFALRRSLPPFTDTQYVYGAGANPVGIEALLRPILNVRPLFAIHGGFLYFHHNIPSVAAAQFNFVGDGRIGGQVRLRNGHTISVMYVFHHLSNWFEARDNPGVDSQMIYLGYAFNFSVKGNGH